MKINHDVHDVGGKRDSWRVEIDVRANLGESTLAWPISRSRQLLKHSSM